MAHATVCPVTISEQSVSLSPEPTILQFFFPNTDRPNGFRSFPPPCTALHSDSALFYLSSYLFGCLETYHQRVVDHNTYGKKRLRTSCNKMRGQSQTHLHIQTNPRRPVFENACSTACQHILIGLRTSPPQWAVRRARQNRKSVVPFQCRGSSQSFFFFAKTRRTVLLHEQPKSETTHKSSCELEHKLTSSQHHESLLFDSFLKIIIREATEHRHLSIFVLAHLQTRVFLNAAVSVPRMPCPGHDLGKTKPKILTTQMLLLVQF